MKPWKYALGLVLIIAMLFTSIGYFQSGLMAMFWITIMFLWFPLASMVRD